MWVDLVQSAEDPNRTKKKDLPKQERNLQQPALELLLYCQFFWVVSLPAHTKDLG
jgi:hypothetical protein